MTTSFNHLMISSSSSHQRKRSFGDYFPAPLLLLLQCATFLPAELWFTELEVELGAISEKTRIIMTLKIMRMMMMTL